MALVDRLNFMLQTDKTLIAEIKLYYDLFIPDENDGPLPLLIAVHGYGAHKRYMMREARLVAPENFVIASIQGPHQHFRPTEDGYRVGFGWLTNHIPEEYIALHHDFTLRVIDSLAAEGTVDPASVYLSGFSQACALNFRFAFTHPDILAGIVGICGGIPSDLDTDTSYRPFEGKSFYLYGDNDEFYTQEQFQTFDRKLSEFLPDYRSKHYQAGHEITEEMRTDIAAWLSEIT